MKRVVILGAGCSGKTTFAVRLGAITGLQVVELDKVFWRPGLVATPREEWVKIQKRLTAEGEWILDGDLGPYDAAHIRLQAADTIIFLDFSLVRCLWRAVRRSQERMDFWFWLLRYRKHSRPFLMKAIAHHAPSANLHVLRTPAELERFLADITRDNSLI